MPRKEHYCKKHQGDKANYYPDNCAVCLLQKGLKDNDRLFEKLDEAMASPERIAQDTAAVGGFVSGLDMTYTAEEIVNRAVIHLEPEKDDHRRLPVYRTKFPSKWWVPLWMVVSIIFWPFGLAWYFLVVWWRWSRLTQLRSFKSERQSWKKFEQKMLWSLAGYIEVMHEQLEKTKKGD
jgi:hypothetical protein